MENTMMKPDRKSSRRDFLKKGSAVLATLGATPAALNAQKMDEETFWLQVRNQFSFTENAVPMNAANLCPSFRAVTDSVEHFTADIDRDCSFNNRAKYSDLLERCRSRIASQLNVSAGANRGRLQGAMARVVDDLREVILLPGIGHWVQQEQPNAVAGLLLDFLEG